MEFLDTGTKRMGDNFHREYDPMVLGKDEVEILR